MTYCGFPFLSDFATAIGGRLREIGRKGLFMTLFTKTQVQSQERKGPGSLESKYGDLRSQLE